VITGEAPPVVELKRDQEQFKQAPLNEQPVQHPEPSQSSTSVAISSKVSKHREDQIVPALMKPKRMTFEEQLRLYDEQVKRGKDPMPNSNLLDMPEEVKQPPPKIDGMLNAAGPLSLLFTKEMVAALTGDRWQPKEMTLKTIINRLDEYVPSPYFMSAFNYLLQLCFDEKSIQVNVQCVKLI
jgi:hypothetical protein